MAVESAWVPDAIASRRALRGVEMTQHPGALWSVNTLHASAGSLHVLTCARQRFSWNLGAMTLKARDRVV